MAAVKGNMSSENTMKAKLIEYRIPSESIKRVIVLKEEMFLNNFFLANIKYLEEAMMVPVGRNTLAKPRPWMRNSQI